VWVWHLRNEYLLGKGAGHLGAAMAGQMEWVEVHSCSLVSFNWILIVTKNLICYAIFIWLVMPDINA
jgi:hypothetical protein